MQYLRSKLFTVFLVAWTVVLGLATPILWIINRDTIVRSYSRFWASGIAWGIWHIVGLRYRITGALPTDGKPRLIVANHQSAWETLIIPTLLKDVTFVAKRELTKIPIFGWYLSKYPMILIDRSGGRATLLDMIKQAEEAISQGRSVLIFPEGTRIPVDDFKPYHFGVAALYKQLSVPVLTIAHNSGCFWNDEYAMRYRGEIELKVIEEIAPGLKQQEFLLKIERSINDEKTRLKEKAGIDEWRWAMG